MSMMKIDKKKVDQLIEELNKRAEYLRQYSIGLSTTDFVRQNIKELKTYDMSRRMIYVLLKKNGVNIGSYPAFIRAWIRVEKKQDKKGENEKKEDMVVPRDLRDTS